MFNRARSTLYRSRWRKFYRGNGFTIIFSDLSQCVAHGLVVTLWPGMLKVLSSFTGSTCFSFSLLFFFFLFSFFLVIAVLVFSLYTATFLQIYKFSSLLPYFPFNSTSCHSPEVVREVLRFTYF